MAKFEKKMAVTSELEKDLIFKSLQKMKIPLFITIGEISYSGFIEEYEGNMLTLKMESPLIEATLENSQVNFVFHNNYHYFYTDVQQLDDEHVVLIVPEELYKNIVRKNQRVRVDGLVFMKFKVIIQSHAQGFRDSPFMDERFIFQEARKPHPAIDKMLVAIKNLVSEFAQKFQVKIFKPEETLAFEERIIKDTKKIFLINNAYEDSITERRFYEEGIISVDGVYRYLLEKQEPRKVAEDKLLDLLQRKRDQRIFSECYIPLLLEGEVVGYIRLINDFDYHRSIKPINIRRVKRYSEILVEALVKYDYFQLESGKQFDIPVLNVSAGGLLFQLNNEKMKKYIMKNTILHMTLKFPNREIDAKGMVIRINEQNSRYAVQFQEINEEDARYINAVASGKRTIQ